MVLSGINDRSVFFSVEVLTFNIPRTFFSDVVVAKTKACSPSLRFINVGVFQPFATNPNFVEVSVSVEAIDVFLYFLPLIVNRKSLYLNDRRNHQHQCVYLIYRSSQGILVKVSTFLFFSCSTICFTGYHVTVSSLEVNFVVTSIELSTIECTIKC